MNWIMDNWFIILGVAAIIIAAIVAIRLFLGLPTKSQIAKIKEWMLWAVTQAEFELGSGTGILKLRFVYDLFVGRFPLVARVISFETFSKWVDEALDEMKKMLAANDAIQAIVAPIE